MRLLIALPLVAILVVLLVSTPLSITRTPNGLYNDEWNGASHLVKGERGEGIIPLLRREGNVVYIFHGTIAELEPSTDSYLVVAPTRVFPDSQVADLRGFLEGGGRVLIADEIGTGRELVHDLGLGLEIPGIGIYTPAYNKTPAFPVGVATGVVPNLPDEIILNRPSVVFGNGTVAIRSPDFSWLDNNTNLRPDLEEYRSEFSFATIVRVGDGELMVLGDSSLFTREMDAVDHAAAQALLDWLAPPGRTVLYDAAHRAPADPIGVAPLLAGEGPTWLKAGALVLGLALVVAASVGFRIERVAPVRRRPVLFEPQRTKMEEVVMAELET